MNVIYFLLRKKKELELKYPNLKYYEITQKLDNLIHKKFYKKEIIYINQLMKL